VELREKVGVASPLDALPNLHAELGPRALAHEGLLALGYGALEADELLREASGESPEELIADALRAARAA
jgi:Holliday junction DNA helicase RuvA